MKTAHLLIEGKVQGVFFRETSRRVAERCEIRGWIRNRDDGKVEALITGEEDNVKQFIDWCREGPEKAIVANVVISDVSLQIFNDYRVIRFK